MCSSKVIKSECLDTLEVTASKIATTIQKSEVLYSNRQRSKAITQSINGKLLYLGSPRHKDYQNAFYCNEVLFQDGNRVTANYCRKRSCVVCSRILAAKLMAGYVKPLMSLPDLQLVTLTAPNVKRHELNDELKRFSDTWRLMYNAIKKLKLPFKGFKKIEITYNSKSGEFNPHFHVLVSGKDIATQLKAEWMKRNADAGNGGQSIVKVKDTGALIEVFKYVTKAIIKDTFDSRALDTMYQSIHGKQVYSAFGIKKVKEIKMDELQTTVITHRDQRVEVWKWCKNQKDWFSPTGDSFNDTQIDNETLKLISVVDKSDSHVYPKEKEPIYDGPSISEIIERSRNRDKILF